MCKNCENIVDVYQMTMLYLGQHKIYTNIMFNKYFLNSLFRPMFSMYSSGIPHRFNATAYNPQLLLASFQWFDMDDVDTMFLIIISFIVCLYHMFYEYRGSIQGCTHRVVCIFIYTKPVVLTILKETQSSYSGVTKDKNYVNKLSSRESIIYKSNIYDIQTYIIYER